MLVMMMKMVIMVNRMKTLQQKFVYPDLPFERFLNLVKHLGTFS